jgi:hypothetical protein
MFLKFLARKHSGFIDDNSMKIPTTSQNERIKFSQYIIRNPVSLQKIRFVPSKGTVIYKTEYNEYWKENIKFFKASDFISELIQYVPPKHKHLIRHYGLTPSRAWEKTKNDGDCIIQSVKAELCTAHPKCL